MTPIYTGADDDQPGTTPPGLDDGATFGTDLSLPLPRTDRLPGLPTPAQVRELLNWRLDLAVARHRKKHGVVHTPEDTHARIEAIQAVRELLGDYARAFSDVVDHGKSKVEDELLDAVGGVTVANPDTGDDRPTGEPVRGMTVRSGAGDIAITKNTTTKTTYDMGQVTTGLVIAVASAQDIVDPSPELIAYGSELARRITQLYGAKIPNITQVRAFADDLARSGDHAMAGAVRSAITSTKKYTGISVKRQTPKPAA